MKTVVKLLLIILISACIYSCGLFKAKYGCPGNGKNVGAERILSGEKVPKAKKFNS